ncbi:3-oxoacyl-[acyl-carrier-protein] reductase [Halobacillus karajensis]|uniref:3-oxoacyl-[acyl-carrier-protein] reductase n=1 Tax=Halobacillus karajensis TaxID=195088 RepID=A0A024P2E2_9BACI|nr:3-oxoacyl-[acyl-carrier-protein] reductase [Halobacillus karajensis]CDQ19773.1 3-oxoacyl-[acyl-carrier-protein] reductase FabG [Halobacillus karajensis]CDQ22233.1 3-oxoacyl-[acyl-carrier-protein] reductase FabG [Halobacillus karajensis]CDQ28074.1 3-oxoacyl-[acyl-carrier-protein] reductase FabG [Halobacillus karajensis]SEH72412.1 3-oxoacyl-[acyl-carrier-protein] reductase [Halobacillus karajensis]
MLQDQVALVTGASRGIGRAIALELASQGAKVAVNYAGSEDKAEAVVQEIKERGGVGIKIQANVSKDADVKRMVKKVVDEFGRLDILVNNAGITKDNLLMRMKEEEFDDVIDTNLKGVFLCTKGVTRQMMKQKYGRIINVASIVGVSGNPGQANYVAAKAGVIGMTKSNAKELAARNIQVNAVAPGYISTDMTDSLTDEQREQMLSLIPLKRLGEAADVARVVRFLATEDAAYMTGQTLHVDGGMVM